LGDLSIRAVRLFSSHQDNPGTQHLNLRRGMRTDQLAQLRHFSIGQDQGIEWFRTTHGNHLQNHILYLVDGAVSNPEQIYDSLY